MTRSYTLSYSGRKGPDGISGRTFQSHYRGENGQNGIPGEHASAPMRGEDGRSVQVQLVSVSSSGALSCKPERYFAIKESCSSNNRDVYGTLPAGRTTLNFESNGGHGGNGADGGNGEDGEKGCKGRNATKYSKAGNGGIGGNGGDAGHGSSGADGGDGGLISVVLEEKDMHLALALGSFQCKGGKGGRKGSHGRAGKGGRGGDGGDSFSWVEDEPYTDINGEKAYRQKSHYHASGNSGPCGKDGINPSSISLRNGSDGRDGSYEIVVMHPYNAVRYKTPFRAKLVGFNAKSDFYGESGFFEPGDFVTLSNFKIENSGGMPTPIHSKFVAKMSLTGSQNPFAYEKGSCEVNLEGDSIRPGYSACLTPIMIDGSGRKVPRFQLKLKEGNYSLPCSLLLPDADLEMEGNPVKHFETRFPVELGRIHWNRKGKTSFEFDVRNISPRDMGSMSETGRYVAFKLDIKSKNIPPNKARLYFDGKAYTLDKMPIVHEIPLVAAKRSIGPFYMDFMVDMDVGIGSVIDFKLSLLNQNLYDKNITIVDSCSESLSTSECSVLLDSDQTHLALKRSYDSNSDFWVRMSPKEIQNSKGPLDYGELKFYPSVYFPKVSDFDITPTYHVKSGENYFYEPGDRLVIGNICVRNAGSMETPRGRSLAVKLTNAPCKIKDTGEHKLNMDFDENSCLTSQKSAMFSGQMILDIPTESDHPRVKSWESFQKVGLTSHFPCASLDFSGSEMVKSIKFRHAVCFETDSISFPRSIVPGSRIPFNPVIRNISPTTVGLASKEVGKRKRRVALAIRASAEFPIDKISMEYKGKVYNLEKPVEFEIDLIESNSVHCLEAYFILSEDVGPYQKIALTCDLVLEQLDPNNLGEEASNNTDEVIRKCSVVQRRKLAINVSVPYGRKKSNDIGCILVTNSDISSGEYNRWVSAISGTICGASWAVYDVSLYNDFTLSRPLDLGGASRCLLDDISNGLIIILNDEQESGVFCDYRSTDFLNESDWIALKNSGNHALIFSTDGPEDSTLNMLNRSIPIPCTNGSIQKAEREDFSKTKELMEFMQEQVHSSDKSRSSRTLPMLIGGKVLREFKKPKPLKEICLRINQSCNQGNYIFGCQNDDQTFIFPTLQSLQGGRVILYKNDQDRSGNSSSNLSSGSGSLDSILDGSNYGNMDGSLYELLLICLPFERKVESLLSSSFKSSALKSALLGTLTCSILHDLTEEIVTIWFQNFHNAKKKDGIKTDRLDLFTEKVIIHGSAESGNGGDLLDRDWLLSHVSYMKATMACLATFWERNVSKRSKYKALKSIVEDHVKKILNGRDSDGGFRKEIHQKSKALEMKIRKSESFRDKKRLRALLDCHLDVIRKKIVTSSTKELHFVMGPVICDGKDDQEEPKNMSHFDEIIYLKYNNHNRLSKVTEIAKKQKEKTHPPQYNS